MRRQPPATVGDERREEPNRQGDQRRRDIGACPGTRVSDPGARDPACTPFSLGSLLDVLPSGGSRRAFSPKEKDRVRESLAVPLPPQAERYPCSRGKRWSRPCGFRRLFQEKVGGPRIPEFFSRSVVSLVTAKVSPVRLNTIGGQLNRRWGQVYMQIMEVGKTPVIAALHGPGCVTLLRSQAVESL